MRTEISVLGPLEVSVDGLSVVPTATKPCQLLAMLAINAGRVVTTAALGEELWGASAPRSAPSVLQTYVLAIRKMIVCALPAGQEDRAHAVLVTRPTGYLLAAEPEAVDAVRYERLSAAGRAAGAAGDFGRAEQLLRAALRQWRGQVLMDVPIGPRLEIEIMRLADNRLADLVARIDAELYLGRHHQLLGDLAALSARHPFSEEVHARHMLALYRSGRPGQALETYHAMCVTMRDQLGVDPSRRLRHLHEAILAGEPALDDPAYLLPDWANKTVVR
jgi:SARP family transcriptional regulator, regulator of embCAB operon